MVFFEMGDEEKTFYVTFEKTLNDLQAVQDP